MEMIQQHIQATLTMPFKNTNAELANPVSFYNLFEEERRTLQCLRRAPRNPQFSFGGI